MSHVQTPADLATVIGQSTSVLDGLDPLDVIDLTVCGNSWRPPTESDTDERWCMLSGGEQALLKIAKALRDVEVLSGRVDEKWQRTIALVCDHLADTLRGSE